MSKSQTIQVIIVLAAIPFAASFIDRLGSGRREQLPLPPETKEQREKFEEMVDKIHKLVNERK